MTCKWATEVSSLASCAVAIITRADMSDTPADKKTPPAVRKPSFEFVNRKKDNASKPPSEAEGGALSERGTASTTKWSPRGCASMALSGVRDVVSMPSEAVHHLSDMASMARKEVSHVPSDTVHAMESAAKNTKKV